MGLHNISKSVTYDIPADNNAADENTKNEIRFHRRDNVLSFSFGVFFDSKFLPFLSIYSFISRKFVRLIREHRFIKLI